MLLATSYPAELERQRQHLVRLGGRDRRHGRGVPRPPHPVYPFGGRTFHLLGDLRNRVNRTARNTSFVERDARIRLQQGYDDYAGILRVRQPDGSQAPMVVVDYLDLVPLRRNLYEPEHPELQRILTREHARIACDAERHAYWLRHEGSASGTLLLCAGRSIEVSPHDRRGMRLESGDETYLGRAALRAEVAAAPPAPLAPPTPPVPKSGRRRRTERATQRVR